MIQLNTTQHLDELASRYVWWENATWAYQHPEIFLANVMNLGTWDDICLLRQCVGDDILEQIITDPPAGLFSPRSWNYWNIKFNHWPVPPLPIRKL